MSGQLTLLDTPSAPVRLPDSDFVPWPSMRPLPLVRSVVTAAAPLGKRVSRVCMPGYHKGRKPGNAGKRFPAEILTQAEVLRLLNATGGGYCGLRDRALYTVFYRTGLRINEALELRPKDVDLEQGRATVLHGKNDKRRVVGMDGPTVETVAEWLEKRRRLPVDGSHPVFCVVSRPTIGKKLYASCVREQLRDAARRAGIDKRVHPHGLRHTFASELAREGIPINVIQRLLGHSNPAVTAHYINHIEPFEAIEVARARAWELVS